MGRFPETDNEPFFPALRLLPHSNRAEHLEQAKRLSTQTALSLLAYENLEYQNSFLVFFFVQVQMSHYKSFFMPVIRKTSIQER